MKVSEPDKDGFITIETMGLTIVMKSLPYPGYENPEGDISFKSKLFDLSKNKEDDKT